MPALGAGRAIALAGGCLGALDQPAVGDTILAPWEPLDSVNLIEQPQAQELADPRGGTQQGEGVGVMLLGRFEDRQFAGAEQRVIVAKQGKVACDTLLHSGIGKALSNAGAVRLVSDFFPMSG